MVIVDKWINDHNKRLPPVFGHLVASTIEELHQFAQKIGKKKYWFENKRGRKQPHYDLIGDDEISKAIENGAKLVPKKELLAFLIKHYGSSS